MQNSERKPKGFAKHTAVSRGSKPIYHLVITTACMQEYSQAPGGNWVERVRKRGQETAFYESLKGKNPHISPKSGEFTLISIPASQPKNIQTCNRICGSSECIYYLHEKEFTSARVYMNYPSAACAASPSAVADTHLQLPHHSSPGVPFVPRTITQIFESGEEML